MDEVTPEGFLENLYAIIVCLACFWSGTVFLSVLTSSMTRLYLERSKYAQQSAVLRRYLREKKISKGLALRLQRNAQHAVAGSYRTMPEDSVELIQYVSEPLRVELHFEMYSQML